MNPKLKPIRDQVVVLLGATSGIGLETARLMAEKGARVAMIDRSQADLDDALEQVRARMSQAWSQVERLPGSGDESGDFYSEPGAGAGAVSAPVMTLEDQVMALEADATHFEQLKSAADQVIQRFGRIDTWVNVSGVPEYALFEDTSPEAFHRVIEVNLLGQSYGAMAALPYLKRQPSGALIFVASQGARAPFPYQAAYNASRHGILGLADTLRLELKYTGIPVSVTTILPAPVNTSMFEPPRPQASAPPGPRASELSRPQASELSRPPSPAYEAKMAAKAILYAAQHPTRELIVGDAGYMVNFIHRLAPTLTGNVIGATSFRAPRSQPPQGEEAQGEYPEEAMRFNPITWLSTHPLARNAIYAALLAGVSALVGWRIVAERKRRRSWRYRLPRMINKYSRQAGKQAVKTTRQAWKQAQGALAETPRLPRARARGFFARGGDMLLGAWAALTSISLPFIRRRGSLPRRMVARVAGMPGALSGRMPWNRQPATARRFNQMGAKMMKQMAGQMAGQMAEQARETGKQARRSIPKAIRDVMPSKNDAKDRLKDGRRSARRETFLEKLPVKNR